MKPDSPFRKAINAIEVWVSVFAMLLLILVVSIQVFCRYVLQDSLAWTEELARYLVIWSVLFGCSFAMRTDSHLELSILSNFSGPPPPCSCRPGSSGWPCPQASASWVSKPFCAVSMR